MQFQADADGAMAISIGLDDWKDFGCEEGFADGGEDGVVGNCRFDGCIG